MATTAKTTTGINVSGLNKIVSAIDSYKSNLNKSSIAVNASVANIQQAIKGSTSEKDITKANTLLTANMKAMLDNLDQYKTMINQVISNYKSNDAQNTSFTTAANNFIK